MINLKNFKLDRSEKNSYSSVVKIKNFIDNLVSDKIFIELFNDLSKATNLEINAYSLKAKKFLYNKFSIPKNKFENFSSFLNLIYQIVIFCYLI